MTIAFGEPRTGSPVSPASFDRDREALYRAAVVAGVVCIGLQRFGLPFAGDVVPIFPLLALAATFIGALRGRVRLDPAMVIGLSALAALGAATTIAYGASYTSLALVLAIWIPSAAIVRGGRQWTRGFVLGVTVTTAFAAALAVLQSIVSRATGIFVDPIATISPSLLVRGYNTTYEVAYGSGWFKSNGMLFLEPSFSLAFRGIRARCSN